MPTAPAARLALPVAALLLAGCGGGSASTASSTAAPVAVTPSPVSPSPAGAPSPVASTAPPSPSAAPSLSASPASTPATASPAGPAPCRTSALRVSLGQGEGAAGSTFVPLVLVNTGVAACTLDGHPGVSTVDARGRQVGHAAGREGRTAGVVLAPGASAHATLREVDAGTYDAAACRPVPVTGLRVYPPDQTASVVVDAPGTACADPAVVLLTVGPVEPGAGDG